MWTKPKYSDYRQIRKEATVIREELIKLYRSDKDKIGVEYVDQFKPRFSWWSGWYVRFEVKVDGFRLPVGGLALDLIYIGKVVRPRVDYIFGVRAACPYLIKNLRFLRVEFPHKTVIGAKE